MAHSRSCLGYCILYAESPTLRGNRERRHTTHAVCHRSDQKALHSVAGHVRSRAFRITFMYKSTHLQDSHHYPGHWPDSRLPRPTTAILRRLLWQTRSKCETSDHTVTAGLLSRISTVSACMSQSHPGPPCPNRSRSPCSQGRNHLLVMVSH